MSSDVPKGVQVKESENNESALISLEENSCGNEEDFNEKGDTCI
jgi:hypothetical protein